MDKEYIKNIFSQFPLFIPEINDALINKNWLLFDDYLETILNYLEDEEEIMLFPWEELITSNENYLPKDIDLNDWQNFGLTILSKQAINFLNGDDLIIILKNLNYQALKNFFNKILDIIPEKNYNEKLVWLEENKPDFYFIFFTLPINPFINNYLKEKYLKISEKEFEKHFNNLNFNLISELLSYQNAENISNFGTENLFSQEKIIKITYLVGATLLGFIKAGNLENEIIKIFELEQKDENLEMINKIKDYILNNYLLPNEEEIRKLYVFTTDILKTKPENQITPEEINIPINLTEEKIKKPDLSSLFDKKDNELQPQQKEEIKEINKEDKPLIINEISNIDFQKTETKDEEKIKPYFSPFKIFNKFSNKTKPEISAKIEKPEEPEKKVINYTENKTNLDLENENNLEEIFLKPKIQEKSELDQDDENTINLKIE